MERRIKILNIFTIIVIIAFCSVQCWWLYVRYNYALQDYETDLYKTISEVMQKELEQRHSSPNLNISIITDSKIVANNERVRQGNSLTWSFNIYVVDRTKYAITDSADLKKVPEHYRTYKPDGINHYQFVVDEKNNERDAYNALERFCIDERCPFSTERLIGLLEKQDIYVSDITVEKTDSTIWDATLLSHESILHPEVTIVWPYDIFGGEQVRMVFPISISPIIKEMTEILVVILVLSLLLIVCLFAQISTIRRQRRIERLRVDFIHTMVHELKRPISTLKMCVSFMRNEKLMHDSQSRESIISDSQNELDNLSAYFSKLRDLTFDYTSEIPLSFAAFSLKSIIQECISKLNMPPDKEVCIQFLSEQDITIVADILSIANIISNLLENAVKYSGENVIIKIGYYISNKDTVIISVEDNGDGIAKKDIGKIFDKFMRGSKAWEKGIPGMGLGLAYVKLLVKAHGGHVSVNSEEGKGSIFIIEFPQGGKI